MNTMSNSKKVFLILFLLSGVFLVCTSFGIKPDTVLFHSNGYQIGINVHHNIFVKILGIVSFSLFILDPLKNK